VIAILFLSADAMGQYLPARGGRTSITKQNGLLGGQRSDLKFEVKSARFVHDPCPPPATEEVIRCFEIEIEVDWVMAHVFMGRLGRQHEASGKSNGAETLSLHWEGFGRWTLKSATRSGTSILAGATPEGSLGGSGTWNGIKITPPSGFETGKVRPLVYKLEFDYTPREGECQVMPIKFRGEYLHTYAGPTRPTVGKQLDVSVSYPWGISVGTSFGVDVSNYIWQKQLFDPSGKSHVMTYTPPVECVAQQSCCGSPASGAPSPSGSTVPGSSVPNAPRGNPAGVTLTGSNIDSLYWRATAPDGEVIGEQFSSEITCGGFCSWNAFFTIPHDYQHATVDLLLVLSSSGGTQLISEVIGVDDPLLPPQMSSSLLGVSDRVVFGDVLLVLIEDPSPGLTEAGVSGNLSFSVQDGELSGVFVPVDSEALPTVVQVGPGLFEAQLPVGFWNAFAPPVPMNGLIEGGHGDVVRVEYIRDGEVLTDTLEIATSPDDMAFDADEYPQVFAARFTGEASGGRFAIEMNEVEYEWFTTPGELGFDFATRLHSDLVGLGFGASLFPDGSVQILSAPPEDDWLLEDSPAWLLDRDPTLGIEPSTICPADMNGDGVVDNGDIGAFIVAFLSGDPRADFNLDGLLDNGDIGAFVAEFLNGCV